MNEKIKLFPFSISLLKFMKKMNEWEVRFYDLYKKNDNNIDSFSQEMRHELSEIYSQHLTSKERRLGRMASPTAGYPPEYDVNSENFIKAEEINGKKVVIETLWTHPAVPSMTEQRRYTMVEIKDEWRLDKKEVFRKTKDKWENRVL